MSGYPSHRAPGCRTRYDLLAGHFMKKLSFLLSLTNNDNDYQLEQATAADEAAKRLGAQLNIVSADNDAINQSQQLLKVIQSHSDSHPDGIIFEPVGGTALPQVARAAAAAGIGWVVLNREVEYIADLRKSYRIPAFTLTSDHEEVGRIQGRQLAALLPQGGSVLYIQGPSESLAAKQRTTGMHETKPAGLLVKLMKAQWTETSAYRTVSSWLRLSTSHQTRIDAIAAQDDSMAMGARKAFEELPEGAARDPLAESALPGLRRLAQFGSSVGTTRFPGCHNLYPAQRRQGVGYAGALHSKWHHATRADTHRAGLISRLRCVSFVPSRKEKGTFRRQELD